MYVDIVISNVFNLNKHYFFSFSFFPLAAVHMILVASSLAVPRSTAYYRRISLTLLAMEMLATTVHTKSYYLQTL